MTGRGAGDCAATSVPGSMNPEPTRGTGWGRGWGGQGRGWDGQGRGRGGGGWGRGRGGGQWFDSGATPPPSPSRDQEIAALRQQAATYEQLLGELKTRLEALETPAAADPGAEKA